MDSHHFNAMNEVKNGADVTSYSLACSLREVEFEHPEWVTKCEPMYHYSVNERRPYFGMILTREGQKALREHAHGTSRRIEMKTITHEEFASAMKAQGVTMENYAFICPICGTIQSATDLINAGAGKGFFDVFNDLAFSCIGRFTGAGPYKTGESPGRGCDWTLGNIVSLHKLEVVALDGKKHPQFELASPEEAQKHAKCKAVKCSQQNHKAQREHFESLISYARNNWKQGSNQCPHRYEDKIQGECCGHRDNTNHLYWCKPNGCPFF